MPPRMNSSARRPVPIALCLGAICVLVALASAASAEAARPGQYKVLLCAGNVGSNAYGTSTNTASPQNPAGIFSFENYCGPAPDPAGNAAFLRIAENQAGGNAGHGAYGNIYFDTPAFVHFKAGGGWTRQLYAFNEGWRARFWVASACCTAQIMTQGIGLPNSGGHWATTGSFSPHLWPLSIYYDFTRFVFEMQCVRPAGCDRTNFNSTDLNTLNFILEDDWPSVVNLTNGSPLMAGGWVKGIQTATFQWREHGSGIRMERIRIDGAERWKLDHACNRDASAASGEYARVFQPCPTADPIGRGYAFDTAGLSDGPHILQACTQDYGQWQGLGGTGSESCDQRTVHTDNTPPGAPSGLVVTSSNPNRYLDRFGAQFALPPNQGSPIAKVHYEVVNAAGAVVKPKRVLTATNPTAITGIEGPAKAGAYRLRVWLEDQVGFTGPAALAPIPRDTTPPAAPQVLSVTSPATPRSADGFDLRWQNIVDAGAPIDAAHYDVLDGSGKVVVPSTTVTGNNIQAVGDLDAPGPAGSYQLRLWLSDAEGNVGAPVTAPLSYGCQRSTVRGATQMSGALNGQLDHTLQQGQGTALIGSVHGPAGAIATSPVCVFTRVETDSARDFLGIALTDGGGGYRFPIPAGPSREVSAVHRDGNRQLSARARLRTVVHPTLRARKTTVPNGKSAFFEGEIPGPHNDNVTIVLQVRSGKGWLAFRRYRTRNDGHFKMTYPFRRTTRATNYVMRAQVREAGGYPYLEGDSDPVTIRVVPGPVKPKKPAAKGRCAKKKKTVGKQAKRCAKKPTARGRCAKKKKGLSKREQKRCAKKQRGHHRAPPRR